MYTTAKNVNTSVKDALLIAQVADRRALIKGNPDGFPITELKNFCSVNGIVVSGDLRSRKTFIVAIAKNKVEAKVKVATPTPVLSIVPVVKNKEHVSSEKTNGKHCGFNYPADLVEKGKVGKYNIYFSKKSGMTIKLIVTGNGERRLYVLTATGTLRHLVEGDLHKKWHVPYLAMKKKWFDAPKGMSREQKKWVISAMKAVLDLHNAFMAHTSKKRAPSEVAQTV